MALTHQVLRDARYRDYFRSLTERGEFVILDNSAFELGEAVGDKYIVEAAAQIHPSEIVLPDILHDGPKTIERVTSFISKHATAFGNTTRFMAVPHGENVQEYIECYAKLSAVPEVGTLGIGAIYSTQNSADKKISGRQLIIKEIIDKGVMSNKAHHLLGLGNSGNLELEAIKEYGVIRSCDSSAAYVQAVNNIVLKSGDAYKKIKQKIDFSDPYSEIVKRDLLFNMQVLEEAAA